MTLLELLQDKGFGPFRKSGSRYVGVCPVCRNHKNDSSFVTKPGSGTGHCFSCNWQGGLVKMLRQLDGIGCKEAHSQLGIECDDSNCPFRDKCKKTAPKRKDHAASVALPATPVRERFQPSAPRTPAELWQSAAAKLVQESQERLLGNDEALAYLAGRGLNLAAVKKYRLGWLAGEKGKPCIFRDRESWGLEPQYHDGGRKKSLWIPRGTVIPTFVGERIDRVRIRRPGEDLRDDRDPKYIAIEGGGNALISLNPETPAQMPVESDLDALLIDHLAGDLVGAIPLTTCTVRPGSEIAGTLDRAVIILVALDSDPLVSDIKTRRVKSAGPVESLWWQRHYPKSERWPVPEGKDPGEAWKAGVDLRQWVLDGLPISLHPRCTPLKPEQKESPKVAFDQKKMAQLIFDAHSRVQSAEPEGAQQWLAQYRSDIIGHLFEVGKAVDAAYEAQDEECLLKALAKWEEYHLLAWQRYRERPPVIERQDELFENALPSAER